MLVRSVGPLKTMALRLGEEGMPPSFELHRRFLFFELFGVRFFLIPFFEHMLGDLVPFLGFCVPILYHQNGKELLFSSSIALEHHWHLAKF